MGKWVKDKVGLSGGDREKKSLVSLVSLKSFMNRVAVWKSLSTISLLGEGTGESHSNVMRLTESIPQGRKVTPSTLYRMNNVLFCGRTLSLDSVQGCCFFFYLFTVLPTDMVKPVHVFMDIPLVILLLLSLELCLVWPYLDRLRSLLSTPISVALSFLLVILRSHTVLYCAKIIIILIM